MLRQTAEAPARMRLVQAKGKKRIHVRETDPDVAALNKSDTYDHTRPLPPTPHPNIVQNSGTYLS